MRNKLMVGITLVLIIGIGLYSVFDSPEEVEKIDLPQVKMATSMDEVKQYFYQQVPALKRAEESSLVEEINKTYELPGVQAEVTIDQAWYNGQTIFLFYHRDVASIGKASTNNNEEKPVPQLYTQTANDQSFTIRHNNQSIPPLLTDSDIESKFGIQFGDQFYSIMPLKIGSNPPIEGKKLNVKGSPRINVNGKEEKVDISVSFKAQPDIIESMKIDQTFTYNDFKIVLDSFDFGTYGTKLFVTITHPSGHPPKNIHVSAITKQGESIKFSDWLIENTETQELRNDYIITGFQAVQSLPKEVEFTLETVSFKGEKSLTFKMDTTRLPDHLAEKDTYEEQPEEFIKVIDQAEVSLASLRFDSEFLNINLMNQPVSDIETPYRTLSFRMDPDVIHQDDVESRAHITASTASDPDTTIIYNGTEIHFEDGKEKLHLGIPSHLIEKEDYVQISLNNLPFTIVFNETRNVKFHP
ncbi:DUF4179 domain-containing protein [Pontibacillus sp. ALD_SL1]|uniref:DUF4179 domain-containing protein n=1 Tax=Pontibacillus sp. ALD_SL1 TaxID=2777185 RepID=UPI001A9565E8|nr:DUF4179 domain-containing protein [Pontibacillus sp. ALD_SL1]QSS98673.1 DUF4179 domain-containing protein [Pontibacillus sp. ALD_SL1]